MNDARPDRRRDARRARADRLSAFRLARAIRNLDSFPRAEISRRRPRNVNHPAREGANASCASAPSLESLRDRVCIFLFFLFSFPDDGCDDHEDVASAHVSSFSPPSSDVTEAIRVAKSKVE